MSGRNPTPPLDPRGAIKSKWMEEMADLTLAGSSAKHIGYLHTDAQVQGILGDYYDSANTATHPLPEHPNAMDYTPSGPTTMAPATTRPQLFQAMAFNWGVDGGTNATSATTAGASTYEDTDVDMGGTDTFAASVPSSAFGRGKRVHKPPTDFDPSVDDPGESPEDNPFRYDQLPQTIRPDSTTARTATAYGQLAENYYPKPNKNNPAPGLKQNAMPGPVQTPQTDGLRSSFATASEFARETTDYEMTMFNDPSPTDSGLRALGQERLSTGLNGPHSVAFKALNTALTQRRTDPAGGGALATQNEKRRLHLDKMFAVNDVPPPRVVMRILMEEEPQLYARNSTPDNPVLADTVPPERGTRIVRYFNAYVELYNQVASVIAGLARSDLTLNEQQKKRILDEAFGRTEELVNLHPYQTYGWRSGDDPISGKEIGGKGEGPAAKDLYGATSSEDTRISGMGRLVDGFDPERMFKNPERYRQFLISRLEFLIGDASDAFPARNLAQLPVEVLFDLMLVAKQKYEADKAAKKAKGANTSNGGTA